MYKLKQHQRHVKRNRSNNQKKRNRVFTQNKNIWNKLTDSERKSWGIFATENQTNYNAFMSLNMIRAFNDLPILSTPPPVV